MVRVVRSHGPSSPETRSQWSWAEWSAGEMSGFQRDILIIQPMAQPPRGQPKQGQNDGIVLLQNKFSSEQLHQSSEALADILRQKQPRPHFNYIEPLPPTMEVRNQSTGTESDILQNCILPKSKVMTLIWGTLFLFD